MILPLFFLVLQFRGAKPSQKFRATVCRRPFQRRDLLPAPRKALLLRSGEQNLHRSSASLPATGGFFSGAICSPLPAKPCCFVPGSKIFTEIPRRRMPAGRHFRGAICSPLPAKPCGFVPGSKIFTEIPRRCVPPATPVGAVPPANAYITVGPRQQGAQNPARRPTMLALSRRQTLISPSGHANRAPRIPPGGRPCWRRPSGKALIHRRATPTGRPGYDEKEKDCRYLSILKSMEQVSAV